MKKNRINQIFKAFFTDLLFWIYFFGCSYYLLSNWFGIEIKTFYVVLAGIIFSLLFLFSNISLGCKIHLDSGEKKRKWYRSFWGWSLLLVLLVTFVVGWDLVEVNPYKFFTKFKNARGIVSGMFNPNFDILAISLTALAETIYLALLATIFAIPFAFIFSFFAARNLMPKTVIGNAVYIIIRSIATLFRSIEAIVWAIIFSVWVGIGPFAGMLALMIHSIAALTKLYSEQIENIDNGPVEAIKATGANTLQVWIFAVIPQIISPYLAFTIYRWDINVRMATIVGFVGGGGIGLLLLQQQQLLRWQNVGLIIWLIAAVVWIMDMTSARVREKLVEM